VEQHGAEDGRARVGHRFAASLWREHAQELDVHGEVVDAIDPAGATAADECHLSRRPTMIAESAKVFTGQVGGPMAGLAPLITE
jgi:hypothetical protein